MKEEREAQRANGRVRREISDQLITLEENLRRAEQYQQITRLYSEEQEQRRRRETEKRSKEYQKTLADEAVRAVQKKKEKTWGDTLKEEENEGLDRLVKDREKRIERKNKRAQGDEDDE